MTKLGVFTKKELSLLKAKHKKVLEDHILVHLRDSPDVHEIIRKELKVRHPKIREAIRAKLLPTFNRLKS